MSSVTRGCESSRMQVGEPAWKYEILRGIGIMSVAPGGSVVSQMAEVSGEIAASSVARYFGLPHLSLGRCAQNDSSARGIGGNRF